jgi:hypothetical protein
MLTLTGTAIGSVLQLENADGTIAVVAQASSSTYATLATKYQIGGTSCGLADNGTGTLSKVVPAVVGRSTAGAQADTRVSAQVNTRVNPLSHSLLEKILEARNAERK